MDDLSIRGATVVDGRGTPRMTADVQVSGGRIASVLPAGQGRALRSLDAQGLVLAPGFIDVHTHDDRLVLQAPRQHPKLLQGVTTVVTGNCGISLAPLRTTAPPAPLDILGDDAFCYDSFQDYLAEIDAVRPAVNVVPLVGHTTLRVAHVKDLERPAQVDEHAAMQAEVRRALHAGAFGLSTGVFYPPARASDVQELIAVAAPLKGHEALLTVHLRDEGDHIDDALREAFAVARSCDARLVLSHHKVVGAHNRGRTRQTLTAIDQAARQQPVCLDCYPYTASSTMLSPARVQQAREVIITWSRPYPDARGRKLADLAQAWGVDLPTAAERLTPAGAIYFSMDEEDVQRVLQHPLSLIGSDGLPHDSRPHPRLWGAFPRVLGHYSRDRGLLSLESAIHKMSGAPAQRLGLSGRGVIAPGLAADLVLFDPQRVLDQATYEDPTRAPVGIHRVWVNGCLAVQDGEVLDLHAGRRLRPPPRAVPGVGGPRTEAGA